MKRYYRMGFIVMVFLVFFQIGNRHRPSEAHSHVITSPELSTSKLARDYYQALLPANDQTPTPSRMAVKTHEKNSLRSNTRQKLLELARQDSSAAITLGEQWIGDDLSAARACIVGQLINGSLVQRELIIALICADPESIRYLTAEQQMRFVRDYDSWHSSLGETELASYFTDSSAVALLAQWQNLWMIDKEYYEKCRRFADERADRMRVERTLSDQTSECFSVAVSGILLDEDESMNVIQKFEDTIARLGRIPLESPHSSSFRGRETFSNPSMADWLSKQSHAIQRTWMADVAESWSHFEPEKSLQWVETLADCREKEEAMQRSVVRWASFEPEKAIMYVERIPPSSLRERVIEDVASYYATYDYPKTVLWLNSLPPSQGVTEGKKRIGLSQ